MVATDRTTAATQIDPSYSPGGANEHLHLPHHFLGPLQRSDAVGWVAGRESGLSKTEWWGAGVVICPGARCILAHGPADATATHCLLLQ